MGFFTTSSPPTVKDLKRQQTKLQKKYNKAKGNHEITTLILQHAKSELVGFNKLQGHILQLVETR